MQAGVPCASLLPTPLHDAPAGSTVSVTRHYSRVRSTGYPVVREEVAHVGASVGGAASLPHPPRFEKRDVPVVLVHHAAKLGQAELYPVTLYHWDWVGTAAHVAHYAQEEVMHLLAQGEATLQMSRPRKLF